MMSASRGRRTRFSAFSLSHHHVVDYSSLSILTLYSHATTFVPSKVLNF
jgi:hypothetical protein